MLGSTVFGVPPSAHHPPGFEGDEFISILVHRPGPQNFEFVTTLRDKGDHTFLETLFPLL